eukprot:s6024_g3.t1
MLSPGAFGFDSEASSAFRPACRPSCEPLRAVPRRNFIWRTAPQAPRLRSVWFIVCCNIFGGQPEAEAAVAWAHREALPAAVPVEEIVRSWWPELKVAIKGGLPVRSVRATEVLCQLKDILEDPEGQGEMSSYHAARTTCFLSCALMSAMEEALKDQDKWIEQFPIHEIAIGYRLLCLLDAALGLALGLLGKAGDPMAACICNTVADRVCQVCRKLAAAYTEQVELVVGQDESNRTNNSLGHLRSISSAETTVLGLLLRLPNFDPVQMASVLCEVGRQKIAVFARVAQVLGSIDEALNLQEEVPDGLRMIRSLRFKPTVQEMMDTIGTPVAKVVQGLAQILSNPNLGMRDEARTVLLGIRSLIALPIFQECFGPGGYSLQMSFLVGKLEHQFKNDASFPALGMKPTSKDLERFKYQTHLLGNAAITSAVCPSVRVGGQCEEDKDGWLQRQEPESRSEMDGWQQVPSAGSWTLSALPRPVGLGILQASKMLRGNPAKRLP